MFKRWRRDRQREAKKKKKGKEAEVRGEDDVEGRDG
jgi:hypothetical protein